ncbi:hypothetical protein [Paracoccus sp. DMF]|uniref:hypothetical protein n=1 Tax=Paracoccus sp. DMF TaxID=400837 RepID=UPI0021E38503|nr:hypothetical protein [Paracoccus sp. DMF]MCV2448998.1 hypothetical protein [Paracoccus sp. DMF]
MKVEKQIAQIVEAIADGMYHPSMKEKMTGLEARREELTALLADAPADTPDILPSASAIYAEKVVALTKTLNRKEERQEASQDLRAPIEKIVLTPGPNRVEIDAVLYGGLGAILHWTERQLLETLPKRQNPPQERRVCLYRWLRGQDLQTVSQCQRRSFRPAPRRQHKACPSGQPEAAQRRSHRRYSDGFDYARFFELADLRRYRSMRDERSGCPSLSAAQ